MVRWLWVLVPACVLYFVRLGGLNAGQEHLLAIFAGAILALIARPMAMGASVVLAMTLLVFTGTLPAGRALAGFANQNVWMIFTAFLFARAIVQTGLGMRIAYRLIRAFGRSPLTLGYCVAALNLVTAPFVPSDTGRGGGIIYPIARSLAQALDSEPGPTGNRIGAFLMLAGFHSTYATSAMFLTGMIANPVVAEFARKLAHVDLTWIRWAVAASVPGTIGLAIIPWVILRLHPPEIRETAAARSMAAGALARLGRMSRNEWWLAAILICVMAGWIASPWHPVPNAFVALAGLCAMLIAGVIPWDSVIDERRGWDALIWFAPLLMMADELVKSGTVETLTHQAFGYLYGWPWPAALLVLVLLYFYVHYGFASLTAHTTALYPGFLAAALSTGAPAFLAVLPLGFFSDLNAGLTHYGTGSAPVFFEQGYVGQRDWWRIGFILSLVNLAIWLGVGCAWWKLIGLW